MFKLSFKKKKKIFGFVVFYIILFLFFYIISLNITDPDIPWHFAMGRDIEETGTARVIEKYNYPFEGQEWVNHGWLADWIMYKIYVSGEYGYWLVCGFYVFFMIASFMVLNFSLKKLFFEDYDEFKFFFYSVTFQSFVAWIMANFVAPRPRVISYFFFSLLISSYLFFIKNKKSFNKRWLFLWVPLFIVWLNLHGGTYLGLPVLLFIFFQVVLVDGERKMNLNSQSIGLFLSLAASLLVATLITPFGFGWWRLFGEMFLGSDGYKKLIFEWMPIYALPIHWKATFYALCFMFCALFAFFFQVIKFKKKDILIYLLYGYLFYLFLEHRRMTPIFVLFTFQLCLYAILKLDLFRRKVLVVFTLLLMIPLFYLFIPKLTRATVQTWNNPIKDPIMAESRYFYAPKMVDFLKNHQQFSQLKIFNNLGLGSYLSWSWPEKQFFIDGRMPIKILYGDVSHIEEQIDIENDLNYNERLKDYEVEMILWSKGLSEEIVNKKRNKLEIFIIKYLFGYKGIESLTLEESFLDRLLIDDQWTLVFKRGRQHVFVKTEIINSLKEKGINPEYRIID